MKSLSLCNNQLKFEDEHKNCFTCIFEDNGNYKKIRRQLYLQKNVLLSDSDVFANYGIRRKMLELVRALCKYDILGKKEYWDNEEKYYLYEAAVLYLTAKLVSTNLDNIDFDKYFLGFEIHLWPEKETQEVELMDFENTIELIASTFTLLKIRDKNDTLLSPVKLKQFFDNGNLNLSENEIEIISTAIDASLEIDSLSIFSPKAYKKNWHFYAFHIFNSISLGLFTWGILDLINKNFNMYIFIISISIFCFNVFLFGKKKSKKL